MPPPPAWSLGHFSRPLKSSQLLWEPVQLYALLLAESFTRTISALTGGPFTPWWREAIIVQCLALGHKCHDEGKQITWAGFEPTTFALRNVLCFKHYIIFTQPCYLVQHNT